MNTLEQLLNRFPDKPWNWKGISRNPNVTMDMIERHPDKPWHWDYVSLNPNLTMEMIERHPDKPWDWWYSISSNQFGHRRPLLPKPSKEMVELVKELHHVFDSPPIEGHLKAIFRKGGFGYWETWNEICCN